MRRLTRPLDLFFLTCAILAPAAVASPVHAHIQLETSSPARDQTVDRMPERLRLLFSGFLEPSYTGVTLTAPDGTRVETGPVVFLAGSDREFTVALPELRLAGTYTVRWRTAGADGHVLEGSYSFVVPVTVIPAVEAAPAAPAPPGADTAPVHGQMHQHEFGESASGDALNVVARLLHFATLMLLIGALTFRTVLLPRIASEEAGGGVHDELKRRAWRTLVAGSVVLALVMLLRLWLQSSALHGAERAWSAPLLTIMLNDTAWGRAWLLQVLLFAVLGAGIAWARPPRDRAALFVAVPATIGLAAVPGLSGHAAAADPAWLAVPNDTLHVLAVGAWLGTLFIIAAVALPVLLRGSSAQESRVRGAAATINAFSPAALATAGIAIVTGVINALLHIETFGQLLTTPYGRTLLVKVCLVALVLLAGLVNWRVIRPSLSDEAALRRLRVSASVELGLAGLVLIATAVLTGQPHP